MSKENITKHINFLSENKEDFRNIETTNEYVVAKIIGELAVVNYYDPHIYSTKLSGVVEECLEKLGFEDSDVLKYNIIGEVLTNDEMKQNNYYDSILAGCYNALDIFYDNDATTRATAIVTIAMHYNNFKNGTVNETLPSLWDL